MKGLLVFLIALIGSTMAANAGCIFGSRLIAAPTCQVQFAPLVPAFYVSSAGNDTNAGTAIAPFATITKAQTAMRASGTIKTTYIRGGTYAPAAIANCDGGGAQFTCMLSLNSSDNGETFSYYPPDGYDTAVFTGGSTGVGTGLFYMIYSTGSAGVTIDGLVLHDFQYSAYRGGGGDVSPTIRNNIIYNGWITTQNTSPGAISCYGCSNMMISHNVIHDIGNWGINMAQSSGDVSGLTVTGNALWNTCTGRPDCSAIYLVDTPQTAANITWTNNYVRDGNTGATLGTGFGSALYADDCASNVTATGNVITGRNGSNTILIHGGLNNHFNDNLTDLGSYQQTIMAEQTSSPCTSMAMSGNQYQHNIIIGQGGGGGYNLLSGTPPNAPAILDNAYFSYGMAALYGDALIEGPTFVGAPGFNRANPISVSTPGKALTASIYVSVAAGNVEMAIYDSTGPGGGPGNLLASTASTAAVAGWNTIPFTSQVSLASGKYYMAWQADNATAQFNYRGPGSDPSYTVAYGPFDAVYSVSPAANNAVISEYVTIAAANIGDAAIEATAQTGASGSIFADPITIASTSSPISGSIYIPVASGNVEMAIYNNAGTGGQPGNLLASTPSVPAVTGWNSVLFSGAPALTAGTYYIVFELSSATAQVQHDATALGYTYSLAYGSFPAVYATTATRNAQYSFFVTIGSGGGPISSGGSYSDSAPSTEDPQLTCWAYTISGSSPVFNAPVSFPGLTQGWGPPGFVIPQTGSPPSSPHTC